MSTKKKVVTPAPKKADTLRALRYLRKTLMAARLYNGAAWNKYEAESKRVHKANKAGQIDALKQVPAEKFKAIVIANFIDGERGNIPDAVAEAAGYKHMLLPPSPRDQRDELVDEIDRTVRDIVLSGTFSPDLSALIKRAEKLMGG